MTADGLGTGTKERASTGAGKTGKRDSRCSRKRAHYLRFLWFLEHQSWSKALSGWKRTELIPSTSRWMQESLEPLPK